MLKGLDAIQLTKYISEPTERVINWMCCQWITVIRYAI